MQRSYIYKKQVLEEVEHAEVDSVFFHIYIYRQNDQLYLHVCGIETELQTGSAFCSEVSVLINWKHHVTGFLAITRVFFKRFRGTSLKGVMAVW